MIDRPPPHGLNARHPRVGSDAERVLATDGFGWLRDMVGRHAIECDWHDAGRVQAAATDEGARSLDGIASRLDALGDRFERLDAAAMRERLGTAYYRAGLHIASGALVQPAALVRGLADALPPQARLFERSRALRWRRRGSGWRVETDGVHVDAPRLLLAAHTGCASLGALQDRYAPLHVYAGITPPLPVERWPAGSLPR